MRQGFGPKLQGGEIPQGSLSRQIQWKLLVLMWLGCHMKKISDLEAVTLQVFVAASTGCGGEKSLYRGAERYQSPGGAGRMQQAM